MTANTSAAPPLPTRRTRCIALGAVIALALAGCGGSGASFGTAQSSATKHTTVAHSGPLPASAGDWATLLHGASHFGAAGVAGPSSATVRWQRQLEAPISAAPVTVGSTAYIASNGGVLHAIEISNGKDLWTFNGGGSYGSDIPTAPTALADGLILWPGPRGQLFALTPKGKLRWTLTQTAQTLTPAVDQALNLLVLADTKGNLSGYRLAGDAAPTRLWTHKLAKISFGNPALAANGTAYQTAGNSLFAVAADGRTLWQVTTTRLVEVSAAVGSDGTIVFGSDDRYEYGIAPDGTIRWAHRIGNLTYSSPLTLAGDRVIYGNHSGEMTILNSATGHPISQDHSTGQIWTAAAVDARGDVYFGSRMGGIYGFGPSGQRLFDLTTGTKFDSYPALATDGTLLIGDNKATLRAIR